MSHTPSSYGPLEPTGDDTGSADVAAAANDLKAAGHRLFECLGVGGMGEVYRCGDDALPRDLALKVLKAEFRGNAAAEERFLREARLTGWLQHPGIVPIHHLGRLSDGRPCYTMKLVRGRTFADLLRDEPLGSERLPRLLTVLEKVCQTVAFAHSRGVIHRDLKPSNIMVGEFGEVQVMDWGLAKVLHADTAATEPCRESVESVVTVARLESDTELSRAGAALGTPSYMPPEQAAGDWAIVDERADVFALGSMLCEMLTGRPPYRKAASQEDVLRRARRGDMAEALERLEKCGAEAALLQLCRDCLSVEREGRPRHAGVLAERLAAYQTQVQERLRRAEVERAAAEVKAREERKRRRWKLALAGSLVLVLMGVAGAAWWRQRQIDQADAAVNAGLVRAELLAGQAQAESGGADRYGQALEAARAALPLAESGSAAMRRRAEEVIARLEQEEQAAAKDHELLTALLDVRGPREGPTYQRGVGGTQMMLAEPTADEQFAAAFRRWGLDIDGTPASEAAARLKARPAVVVMEVIAALDEWASERRRQGKSAAEWQRLAKLATLLDADPSSMRRELRAILSQGQLPLERVLSELSMALRPVPLPVEGALGRDRRRLRQLAEKIDPSAEPILGVLTLVRALRVAGEEARAESLLRATLLARPREVVLHHTLGQLLETRQPPRWAEAVECYAAARVLRPDLGVNLATALLRSGRESEGLALLAHLVAETPSNPYLHFKRANALADQGQLNEAMVEFRQAIALAPKLSMPHNNLGIALHARGRLDEAMEEFRQAIALDPKNAVAHHNLGAGLHEKKQLDEAMAEYRQALALNPKLAQVHNNVGVALARKGRWEEARTEYRQALALNPKNAAIHYNFGLSLHANKQLDEAMNEYRQAIALDPKDADARFSLGNVLRDKGRLEEAVEEYRRAIALDPKNAKAHNNLGNVLRKKKLLEEAMAEYRQAIALDPKFADAHNNLGTVLYATGRPEGAMREYRQAIALDPKNATAHVNLGLALAKRERLDAALEEYRQAIALDPKNAHTHGAMGQTLLQQGRYAAATQATQRALELIPTEAPLHRFVLQQLQQCEFMLALDKKLPAILTGEAIPANPGETITLASMCQQHKKRYAASARFYADAFRTEPRLVPQHRYNAACSAVLAAAGQGEDARVLPDKAASMFRRWSLTWLREDLQVFADRAQQNNPRLRQAIQQRLAHWQRDADLAFVRDVKALAGLSENERAAWQALWREVDELAARLAKQSP